MPASTHPNGIPTHPLATVCVLQAIQGLWLSAALRTLLELGVPEVLAAEDALTLQEVRTFRARHTHSNPWHRLQLEQRWSPRASSTCTSSCARPRNTTCSTSCPTSGACAAAAHVAHRHPRVCHRFAANDATKQLVRADDQPSLGHLAGLPALTANVSRPTALCPLAPPPSPPPQRAQVEGLEPAHQRCAAGPRCVCTGTRRT